MILLGDKVPNWLLIALMVISSIVAGAIWGGIPAICKAKWNTNETLFTLMMNYVATQLVAYFVILWEVPKGAGKIGIGWASSGGEASAILNDRYLAADGIENVIDILDKIENGSIPQLEFIELNACIGGCVGGVMTIENPFIAKTRLQTVRSYLPVARNFLKDDDLFIPENYILDTMPSYKPMTKLGSGMGESIKLMAKIQAIKNSLPGIDCGACGSPTCRAFAEDIVKGTADPDGCVVKQ